MSVGTSARSRFRLRVKNTTPDTASATRPPLLCVISQPASRAHAPPLAAPRNTGRMARCDASATQGQKPIRKRAAWALTYEIGKVNRPCS